MKVIQLLIAMMAVGLMAVSCEASDVSEEQIVYDGQESVDFTNIKKRT